MKDHPCPECGSTDFQIIEGMTEERNGYTKVQCRKCQSFFFAPSDAPNVANAERLS